MAEPSTPAVPVCAVPGCDGRAKYRGICNACYQHYHKFGDTTERGKRIAAAVGPDSRRGRGGRRAKATITERRTRGELPPTAKPAAKPAESGRADLARIAEILHLTYWPFNGGTRLVNIAASRECHVDADGTVREVTVR